MHFHRKVDAAGQQPWTTGRVPVTPETHLAERTSTAAARGFKPRRAAQPCSQRGGVGCRREQLTHLLTNRVTVGSRAIAIW